MIIPKPKDNFARNAILLVIGTFASFWLGAAYVVLHFVWKYW